MATASRSQKRSGGSTKKAKPAKLDDQDDRDNLDDRDDLAKLDRLADEYLILKEQAALLNSEAQTLYNQIGELADRRKIQKYRAPGYSVTRCKGRKKLSKTRLIEEGVEADVIERCEVPGKPYYLIRRVENGVENGVENEG